VIIAVVALAVLIDQNGPKTRFLKKQVKNFVFGWGKSYFNNYDAIH